MSAASLNPMEKSMVSVLVVANTGGGSPLLYGIILVIEGARVKEGQHGG
jgi:hypothetical protein